MRHIILFSTLATMTNVCLSAQADCHIDIDNVNTATKYRIDHSFEYEVGDESPNRKRFDLPGSEFVCTLAFFDFESGTMLSCELDEIGDHFIQSDRTAISEDTAINHLSFRFRDSFYVLHTSCSPTD